MEQRLKRKGWGRGGWKAEGYPWPHGCSRLPKTPAEGKTPQKREIVGLSVNEWLHKGILVLEPLDRVFLLCLGSICCISSWFCLSELCLSPSLNHSQKFPSPMDPGVGCYCSQSSFPCRQIDAFPDLDWTSHELLQSGLFISFSSQHQFFFWWDILRHPLLFLVFTLHVFMQLLWPFPPGIFFRARTYSSSFPICSQGVSPCWNIPMFRSK